jgi:hypothetical protein
MTGETGGEMSFKDILIWASRITGIYSADHREEAKQMREQADKLVRDVDRLDQELRRIGIRRVSPRPTHGH